MILVLCTVYYVRCLQIEFGQDLVISNLLRFQVSLMPKVER